MATITSNTSELTPTFTTEGLATSADAYSPSVLTVDIERKRKDLRSRRVEIDRLWEQFKEKEQHFQGNLGAKKLSELKDDPVWRNAGSEEFHRKYLMNEMPIYVELAEVSHQIFARENDFSEEKALLDQLLADQQFNSLHPCQLYRKIVTLQETTAAELEEVRKAIGHLEQQFVDTKSHYEKQLQKKEAELKKKEEEGKKKAAEDLQKLQNNAKEINKIAAEEKVLKEEVQRLAKERQASAESEKKTKEQLAKLAKEVKDKKDADKKAKNEMEAKKKAEDARIAAEKVRMQKPLDFSTVDTAAITWNPSTKTLTATSGCWAVSSDKLSKELQTKLKVKISAATNWISVGVIGIPKPPNNTNAYNNASSYCFHAIPRNVNAANVNQVIAGGAVTGNWFGWELNKNYLLCYDPISNQLSLKAEGSSAVSSIEIPAGVDLYLMSNFANVAATMTYEMINN